MLVTVHKLLIHDSEIVKHAIVPIGTLSEDAQEGNHKTSAYTESFLQESFQGWLPTELSSIIS